MDFILSRVTQQAMNYAIRSGIIITSSFAIEQCSRLLRTKDGKEKDELQELQKRLQSKIQIIAPAIDMIELITARGNTSLESAVTLTKALRWDIQALGVRLSNAAAHEEVAKRGKAKDDPAAEDGTELRKIMAEIRKLLGRIEDAVPLINLAITTSGVSLSTSLPSTVSPSRLLQASTFLSAGDARYVSEGSPAVQIGPVFTLSMYMLFLGHTTVMPDEEALRSSTWKEVIHKARLRLVRTSIEDLHELPFSSSNDAIDGNGVQRYEGCEADTMHASVRKDEYAYQLLLVEDLDDGRVHTIEEGETAASSFAGVDEAGVRTVLPIHEISKLFYADTGKILNIGNDGETNNPILLLKRDPNAFPPRKMTGSENLDQPLHHEEESGEVESQLDAQILRETSQPPEEPNSTDSKRNSTKWEISPNLDPEWIALEVYNEDAGSENEDDHDHGEAESSISGKDRSTREESVDPVVTTALSNLRIASSPQENSRQSLGSPSIQKLANPSNPFFDSKLTNKNVQTSLSLLEMLIRLTSLQQFQQASHLTINDELLNFFLRESSTTGAPSGDTEARQRIRMDARMRLGFDPYNESPIRSHGEGYQIQANQEYRNEAVTEWDGGWGSHERSPPPFASSPLLSRNRESASPSTRITRSSSPRVGGVRSSMTSLNTPPATNNSKRTHPVEHVQHLSEARSSPLARHSHKGQRDVVGARAPISK